MKNKLLPFMLITCSPLLFACNGESTEVARLKKENDSLKAAYADIPTFNKMKMEPRKWSEFKPWIRKFQLYYGTTNYSSFLVKKQELNKFFVDDIAYIHVLWARNPSSPYNETIVLRGVKEDGTIAYLNENDEVIYGDDPTQDIEYILEHTIPCPPCLTDTGSPVEHEY